MDITQQLRKAARLFVELPQTESLRAEEGAEEAETAQQAQGPGEEIAAPCTTELPRTGEFAAIYAEAGLPAVPFSAEEMREMLRSLPAELPLPMRRQTIKVTLDALGKTVGANADTITADASRKVAALAAYAGRLTEETARSVSEAEAEIAALQAQMHDKHQAISSWQVRLEETVQQCRTEADHLGDVLEFFSPTGHIE